MKTELAEDEQWARMSPEEKKKQLFLRQKHALDLFLERHAIDQRQYDKGIAEMKEKMGIDPES